MDIGVTQRTPDEVHEFCKENYRADWHHCQIVPWPSLRRLETAIPQGLIWEASEHGRLLGIMDFIAVDEVWQPIGGYCASRGRGRDVQIIAAIVEAANQMKPVVLPRGPWYGDSSFRDFMIDVGIHRPEEPRAHP